LYACYIVPFANYFQKGDAVMGDAGKKDKGGKEQKKKPKLTQKEKRKLKQEKKHPTTGHIPG
jgi:hypothetical protein